jgi:DNA polymerase-3 subunit gamma/tau
MLALHKKTVKPRQRIEVKKKDNKPVEKPVEKEVKKEEIQGKTSKFDKNNYRSPNSLESILKEGSKAKNSISELKGNEDMPKTPFGQDQVDKFWKLFVQNHVDKKNRSLYTTLNQSTPELQPNFHLVFPIENKVQLNQIEVIKVDLVNYLREHLVNYAITFATPVKKNESKKHIYTDEERYKAMVEKNPLLEELRKKLDLDLNH